MATRADAFTLFDNKAKSRYEAHLEGQLAGFCAYELLADRAVLPHTEIAPAFEDRGVGGELVAYALDDLRSRHLKVVPTCSFVGAYIRSHPEYVTMVVDRS